MWRIRIRRALWTTLALMLLPLPPAAAEEAPGMLMLSTYLTTKAGMGSQLEAGFKAHNALHAQQKDPVAVYTWQIVSGPETGNYIRATLGRHWKDLDGDPQHQAADAADAAQNINPYVDSAMPAVWELLLETSLPPTKMEPLSRIITFHVRYGHEQAFREAVGKIHEVLAKRDWDPYLWYALVDGGRLPTYMVILPRASYAGFDPGDKQIDKVMAEAYGEEAQKIFEDFQATVESATSEIAAYRPDLSYLPGSGSE